MPVIIDGTNGVSTPNTFAFKNRIIDGGFTINQRGYVTNTSLTSGSYGHDRWKGGASNGTYTFTQASAGVNTTITITAGSIIQVIEGANLPEGGTYVLSWTGTAQGKIGAGSFGASGITGTITAGTNTNIEFNTGTCGNVQLEVGSTATSFDYRPYGTELALCQRYYYKFKSTGSGIDYALGYALSSTGFRDITAFPVTMRTVPSSLEQTGTASDYSIRAPAGTVTCSAVPFYYGGTANVALTEYTVSSGLTTGQGSSSRFANSNAYVAWSAEL